MEFRNEGGQSASTPSRKILVVDDEQNLAEVIATNLKAAGYDVSVACDGETGLATARRFDPDLVLLDFNMPGINGAEACRVLRELGGKERPKIIVMSSGGPKVKEEVEELMKDSLANGFLPKPFPLKELLPKVRLLLMQLSTTPQQ